MPDWIRLVVACMSPPVRRLWRYYLFESLRTCVCVLPEESKSFHARYYFGIITVFSLIISAGSRSERALGFSCDER